MVKLKYIDIHRDTQIVQIKGHSQKTLSDLMGVMMRGYKTLTAMQTSYYHHHNNQVFKTNFDFPEQYSLSEFKSF